jgi:hypothetical protein
LRPNERRNEEQKKRELPMELHAWLSYRC